MPVFVSQEDLLLSLPPARQAGLEAMPTFVHVLTHKDLHLKPMRSAQPARDPQPAVTAADGPSGAWFGPDAWPALGLPAPIRKLLVESASGAV
jgi:A/G-specific adenine glycosylase